MKKRKLFIEFAFVLVVSLALVPTVQAEGIYATDVLSSAGVTNSTDALGAPDDNVAILEYIGGSMTSLSLDFVNTECTSLGVYGGAHSLKINVFGTSGAWMYEGYVEGFVTINIGEVVDRVIIINTDGTNEFPAFVDAVECVTTAAPQPEFGGFLDPIAGEGFNVAKAGRAVPVKFSLGGDFGLDIMSSTSVPIACDNIPVTGDVVDTISAGASSLTYDPLTDIYTYVWKTDKSWKATCRQLTLTIDGSTYTADFKFK